MNKITVCDIYDLVECKCGAINDIRGGCSNCELEKQLQTKGAEIERLAKNLIETLEKNSELLLEQVRIGNRFEEKTKTLTTKVSSLKEELEREHKQVHDMCEQLALLTRCTKIINDRTCIDDDLNMKCRGCKNKARLEKDKV